MNLKELIENNIDQFEESTVFKEINENDFIVDFNSKLKIQFELTEEERTFNIIVLNQDERFWNKDETSQDENNKFNYQSFNGWEIRTNNEVFLSFNNQFIDLKGCDKEDDNEDWSYYFDENQIIELILALEDWSLNCPFFKEEIREEVNKTEYPIIDHSLNNNIAIYSPDYNKYIADFLQQIQNIIKEKDDKIQELENKLLETNKTVDENKRNLKNIIIELIEGV